MEPAGTGTSTSVAADSAMTVVKPRSPAESMNIQSRGCVLRNALRSSVLLPGSACNLLVSANRTDAGTRSRPATDVDTGEAAPDLVRPQVVEQHRGDGERPQGLDVVAEIAAPRLGRTRSG